MPVFKRWAKLMLKALSIYKERQKEASEGDAESRGEVRLVVRVNAVVNSTSWVLFVVTLIVFQVGAFCHARHKW